MLSYLIITKSYKY